MTMNPAERFLFEETTFQLKHKNKTPNTQEEARDAGEDAQTPEDISEVNQDIQEGKTHQNTAPESDGPRRTSYQRRAMGAPYVEAQKATPKVITPLNNTIETLDELLRDRETLLTRIERGMDLQMIARTMLLSIFCATAVLGVAMGFFRGGVQILYAAIKVPLVVLMAVSICAPCFTAIKRALDQPHSIIKDFALVLCSMALASMVMAALSPLLLLVIFYKMPYHQLFLFLAVLASVGGGMGYMFFFKGINRTIERGHRLICATVLIVLALVGAQLGWVLRPYLVRPASTSVPFVRNIEGGFIEALQESSYSARGIYRRAKFKTSNPQIRRKR